jgi:hypothetical protein
MDAMVELLGFAILRAINSSCPKFKLRAIRSSQKGQSLSGPRAGCHHCGFNPTR